MSENLHESIINESQQRLLGISHNFRNFPAKTRKQLRDHWAVYLLLFKQCRLDDWSNLRVFNEISTRIRRSAAQSKVSNGDIREVCSGMEAPSEWKRPIWELQIHPLFYIHPPSLPPPRPLTASWSKKWEIQMLFTFSSLSGFQAIYWGDRFLKLIRHRWHHLAADQRGPVENNPNSW